MLEDEELEFPCEYPIKVFGLAGADFESQAIKAIQSQCHDMRVQLTDRKESEAGKYRSATIIITALSREQVDSIYKKLKTCPDILLVM